MLQSAQDLRRDRYTPTQGPERHLKGRDSSFCHGLGHKCKVASDATMFIINRQVEDLQAEQRKGCETPEHSSITMAEVSAAIKVNINKNLSTLGGKRAIKYNK